MGSQRVGHDWATELNWNGKRSWERIDTYIHITESLCYTPETNNNIISQLYSNVKCKHFFNCSLPQFKKLVNFFKFTKSWFQVMCLENTRHSSRSWKDPWGTQTTSLVFPVEALLSLTGTLTSHRKQNFLEQIGKDARDPGKSQRSYSRLHFQNIQESLAYTPILKS